MASPDILEAITTRSISKEFANFLSEGIGDVEGRPESARQAAKGKANASSTNIDLLTSDFEDSHILDTLTKDWDDKDQASLSRGQRLLASPLFQFTIGILVLLNTITLGVEADYPDEVLVWTISGNFFTIAFLLEMLVKVYIMSCRGYLKDKGNWLDGSLVALAILDNWVITIVAASLDMQSFSLLRLLRMMRLIRVVRLFKQFQKFLLICRGILDALRATCWVGFLVCSCIYVCAIFCTDFIGRGNLEAYPGYQTDEELIDETDLMSEFNPYLCFGSMSRSMLTLFNMVIGAEWTEVVRPVAVKEPYLILFFVGFSLFVSYGVMNVIIAMIVDSVIQNARAMQEENEKADKRTKLAQLNEISELVKKVDLNHDGLIDQNELTLGMDLPEMKKLLREINAPKGITAEELLAMLDDDGDGTLSFFEIVRSLYRLIDCDNFQRMCISQMGINKVQKRLAETETFQKEMETWMQAMDTKLSRFQSEVRVALCVSTPEDQVKRLIKSRSSSSTEAAGDETHADLQEKGFAVAEEPLKAKMVDGNGSVLIENGDKVATDISVALESCIAEALKEVQRLDEASAKAAAHHCRSMMHQEVAGLLDRIKRHAGELLNESVQCALEEAFGAQQCGSSQPRPRSKTHAGVLRLSSSTPSTNNAHVVVRDEETNMPLRPMRRDLSPGLKSL